MFLSFTINYSCFFSLISSLFFLSLFSFLDFFFISLSFLTIIQLHYHSTSLPTFVFLTDPSVSSTITYSSSFPHLPSLRLSHCSSRRQTHALTCPSLSPSLLTVAHLHYSVHLVHHLSLQSSFFSSTNPSSHLPSLT